ncbi:hypothetical protein BASA81_006515 [Batrachochytrium salamandrivorans]|nr:hypothetical protein BASA81_006515 [Batrachochytrium salamandrivorans]
MSHAASAAPFDEPLIRMESSDVFVNVTMSLGFVLVMLLFGIWQLVACCKAGQWPGELDVPVRGTNLLCCCSRSSMAKIRRLSLFVLGSAVRLWTVCWSLPLSVVSAVLSVVAFVISVKVYRAATNLGFVHSAVLAKSDKYSKWLLGSGVWFGIACLVAIGQFADLVQQQSNGQPCDPKVYGHVNCEYTRSIYVNTASAVSSLLLQLTIGCAMLSHTLGDVAARLEAENPPAASVAAVAGGYYPPMAEIYEPSPVTSAVESSSGINSSALLAQNQDDHKAGLSYV